MASLVNRAISIQAVQPPSFLQTNLCYEALMGSRAYGVHNSESTDYDVYGFCIPNKEIIFSHTAGIIQGFGNQGTKFDQWQQTHVKDLAKGKEYDFNIYNIVRYFHLCMNGNPNMIDSLFVPETCVLFTTYVGNLVREHRKLFLSKKVWKTFYSYAYSQIKKIDKKDSCGKRAESINKYGYDVKQGYHLHRLLGEALQLLEEGDLDLMRNREELKTIRRGEWSLDQVKKIFYDKLPTAEEAYRKTLLPDAPDEGRIKQLLLDCLEHHYGKLTGIIEKPNELLNAIKDIEQICQKVCYQKYPKILKNQ